MCRRSVRLVGACHKFITLGAACLGAYLGVGAIHLTRQNIYLGVYPGYYGTCTSTAMMIVDFLVVYLF